MGYILDFRTSVTGPREFRTNQQKPTNEQNRSRNLEMKKELTVTLGKGGNGREKEEGQLKEHEERTRGHTQ